MRGWIYRNIIFSFPTIFRGGDEIVTLYFHPWQYLVRGEYIVTLYFHSWQYLVRGWLYRDIIFSPLTMFNEGVIISSHIFTLEDIWWGGDYIVTLQYHFWHYPRIWHWRWLYLNIFTFQIWLCSDTRVLLFISIYSPHETWGVEWLYLSMIPSLLLKLSVLVDMLMDCINSLWWTKICKKSLKV